MEASATAPASPAPPAQSEPPAATPAPAADPPAAPPAPAAPSAGDKRPAEDAPAAPATKKSTSDTLKSILRMIPNEGAQNELVELVAGMARETSSARNTSNDLKAQVESLTQKQKNHAHDMESMARQNGSMLAHIIGKLTGGSGGNGLSSDDQKELASTLGTAMAQDSKLFQTLNRTVPVACSNLDGLFESRTTAQTQRTRAFEEVEKYKSLLDNYGQYDSVTHGAVMRPPETKPTTVAGALGGAAMPAGAAAQDPFAAPPPPAEVGAPTMAAGVGAPPPRQAATFANNSNTIAIAASNMELANAMANDALPGWLEQDLAQLDARTL